MYHKADIVAGLTKIGLSVLKSYHKPYIWLMFQKIIVGLSCLVLTACGGGSWPDADQNSFIADCKAEGGKTSYCKCYLETVMEKYPNASDWKQMDFETAVELAKDCK